MMSLLRLPYAPLHSSVKSPSFFSVSGRQGTRLGLPSKAELFPDTIQVLKPRISVKCGTWCLLSDRQSIRLGLPSKGELNPGTMELLKDCQLSVKQDNPRQYVSQIPQLSNLDVWFQRPKDIVRNLLSGDLDLGIVGLDTISEYGQGNEDIVIVHEALEYGDCRLSLLVPQYGIFENIKSLEELAKMPQWREENPLRVATGFTYLGNKFMKENGLKHVKFSTADGALEAAPVMGIADAILDLVSSGTTLRENNLKEIEGGVVLESQAALVASRKSMIKRKGALETTHEMLERLEAHLRAIGQFTVHILKFIIPHSPKLQCLWTVISPQPLSKLYIRKRFRRSRGNKGMESLGSEDKVSKGHIRDLGCNKFAYVARVMEIKGGNG